MFAKNISVKKVNYDHFNQYYCNRCDHGYSKAKEEKKNCFIERKTDKKRFTDKEFFPIEAEEEKKQAKVDSYKPPSNWTPSK